MGITPPSVPHNTGSSSIVRDANRLRKQDEAERKKREEERKRALTAEMRRKAGESSQKR